MPFKYVGGKVKVYESLEYFTTWLQFVEFIKSFSFENVKNVYQQVSLESIDNHEALRHIYDEDTIAAALKLVCERRTRLIHNDGEREDGGVEELQTCENHNDDGGDEKEDADFEPSTDEDSDEDPDTENSSNESNEDLDGYETEYLDSDDGGELDSEVDEGGEGSTIVIDAEPSSDLTYSTFRRMYFCFNACKQGFLEGCRHIFGVDGCFLKGELKGEILTAVGRDANDQMFPIAWAIVEVENKDSWLWFLNLLKVDLGADLSGGHLRHVPHMVLGDEVYYFLENR
ncbi:zinc finger, PMZ-type containing protein [Tanacetum coccineum]